MSNQIEENADHWVNHLQLKPHPEGGYYREFFRSEIAVSRNGVSKQACTSIYYLLSGADFSAFHRLKSDELWYFHKGQPMMIHLIDPIGNYRMIELSDQISGSFQAVIEQGSWFAVEIPSGIGYSLISCAVAPGFEFSEFEMANLETLSESFPAYRELITKLCR